MDEATVPRRKLGNRVLLHEHSPEFVTSLQGRRTHSLLISNSNVPRDTSSQIVDLFLVSIS